MITDFTDAFGTPILPGCQVAVACLTGYSNKRAEIRLGKVYRVSMNSIGVDVKLSNGRTEARSYVKPKNFIVLK